MDHPRRRERDVCGFEWIVCEVVSSPPPPPPLYSVAYISYMHMTIYRERYLFLTDVLFYFKQNNNRINWFRGARDRALLASP